MKTKPQTDQGFTIIELLIGLLLSIMVMIGIWNTFHFQQQSYALQRQKVAMEQNLRAGMQLMEQEIRMAGCDPTGLTNAGFETALPDAVRFTMDINNDADTGLYDGDVADSNEDITYTVYTDADGIQKLGRISQAGGVTQPVAEHIKEVLFEYLDSNGNATAAVAQIRAVRITLTAQTANTNPTREASLTSIIKCRNMGI
jgi:type IV pilus assembly protein PilW